MILIRTEKNAKDAEDAKRTLDEGNEELEPPAQRLHENLLDNAGERDGNFVAVPNVL